MNYLEEAATLLRKAAQTNEEVNSRDSFRADRLIEGRERIAGQFAALAAIERGVTARHSRPDRQKQRRRVMRRINALTVKAMMAEFGQEPSMIVRHITPAER